MGAKGDSRTKAERTSDRDLVFIRTFNAPARLVFEAWTKADLFKQWWAPKSSPVPMIVCEMDVLVGGGYRVAFGHDPAKAMAFFGKYTEVVPNKRLVWTNEESGETSITTVTFEDKGDQTLLVMHERYPSKEALDGAFVGMEMESGTPEQFDQLEEFLATRGAGT